MVPEERRSGAPAAAAAEELAERSIPERKKCERKMPKKVHKAEREKLKRDHLNDLFTDLGNMLEADRQNNGKACILGDTTRILRDLLSQVESLRKENSALQNESNYVTVERNELQDENVVLRNEISELQSQLQMRLGCDSIWPRNNPRPAPAVLHPTGTVFPLQQPPEQPPVIEQAYTAPPQELQLFPEPSTAEHPERSQDLEASNCVTRPQARYPTPASSWPVRLFPGMPRPEDEQCSSGTTGSSKEGSIDRWP